MFHVFTIILFYFFMCDAKNFKTFQKNVSIPRMDEKKLHTLEFQLKGAGRNMRCFKKRSTEKTTQCSKHLQHITIGKDIFSELRCIFQISLEYIKSVIPKILFILVLSNFNLTSKLHDPLNIIPLPPK